MPLAYQIDIPQTAYTQITSDTTTGSATYVTLLTMSVTTGANPVIVEFVSAADCSSVGNQTINFRLSIDGSVIRGSAIRTEGSTDTYSTAIIYKSAALTAGSHTFLIEWSVSGGTGRIRPTTVPDDHASLAVHEVTV
jgi:hypothetical protein